MLLKLTFILYLINFSYTFNEENVLDWDLAVALDGHIELLENNGTTIGMLHEGYTQLKALSFDNIRHEFIVSTMDGDKRDTIFSLDLKIEQNNDSNSLIADLPDDVQGLAVDPIEDTLYWTDSLNRTINYIKLNEKINEIKYLYTFDNERPQDITIDACRRYIYWTNSDRLKPTIERSKIGTTNKEILIDTDLVYPAGITIDHQTKKIYWADVRGGIYYRIESSNFHGKEREIVYQGIYSYPFSIAVKDEFIYFTDLHRLSLWKYDLRTNLQPIEIRNFDSKPMGLVAKKEKIKTLPDCKILEETYKNYTLKPIKEIYEKYEKKDIKLECINGVLQNGLCKCDKGYSGTYCEISFCHNYCLHGTCYLTNQGFPYCHCPNGYGGTRCEKNCENYCLNGGKCKFSYPNSRIPICTCPDGFKGPKCQESLYTEKLCDVYCSEEKKTDEKAQKYCQCSRRSYELSAAVLSNETTNLHYFEDPFFLSMSSIAIFALIMCVILSILILRLRRKPSPIIKRRYIINRNPSTSRTERPSSSEQCEITIENCCNMNVCETPCFEPPRLQSYRANRNNNDDKKMLLQNMEKGEDLY